MLDQNAILDPHNVRGNPIHSSAGSAKSTVRDHQVSFRHDRSVLVLQPWRKALDEIEETFTTRCDTGAMLTYCGDQNCSALA